MSALARAQSGGNAVWQEARAADDFGAFAPALRELIGLRREQASQLAAAEPVERSPWEILAQPFEPDISKARLQELFTPLEAGSPPLLERAATAASPAAEAGASATGVDLPETLQEPLCAELLDSWGYDASRCQRSRSAHPFSCTVGPQDFRITTRVVHGQPFSAFLATAHEWGHSLYEQGLPHSDDHYFPWPLGEATSMGVHESQSLFWECRVARSRAFAERWHPRFCRGLGADPWGGAFGFWRALNPLRPGLIRVEADELSYCLHIVLRFELELALLEQEMPVEELPEHWNRRMRRAAGHRAVHRRRGLPAGHPLGRGPFRLLPLLRPRPSDQRPDLGGPGAGDRLPSKAGARPGRSQRCRLARRDDLAPGPLGERRRARGAGLWPAAERRAVPDLPASEGRRPVRGIVILACRGGCVRCRRRKWLPHGEH